MFNLFSYRLLQMASCPAFMLFQGDCGVAPPSLLLLCSNCPPSKSHFLQQKDAAIRGAICNGATCFLNPPNWTHTHCKQTGRSMFGHFIETGQVIGLYVHRTLLVIHSVFGAPDSNVSTNAKHGDLLV